jgi:hypothetical protein
MMSNIMAGAFSRNDYSDVTSMAYYQLTALKKKLDKNGGSAINAAHYKYLVKEIGKALAKGDSASGK